MRFDEVESKDDGTIDRQDACVYEQRAPAARQHNHGNESETSTSFIVLCSRLPCCTKVHTKPNSTTMKSDKGHKRHKRQGHQPTHKTQCSTRQPTETPQHKLKTTFFDSLPECGTKRHHRCPTESDLTMRLRDDSGHYSRERER